MRPRWVILAALLLACDVVPGRGDVSFPAAEVEELAVASFLRERADPGFPVGPLHYRGGSVFDTDVGSAEGKRRVWQVRHARADVISLPLAGRERLSGVDWRADVLVRFEHGYCDSDEAGTSRCDYWQLTTCCNQVWQRRHGEWSARDAR